MVKVLEAMGLVGLGLEDLDRVDWGQVEMGHLHLMMNHRYCFQKKYRTTTMTTTDLVG